MTVPRTTDRRSGQQARPQTKAAFSLMEMVVVIGLVALMATIALPSIIALYNAGADSQAYNLIAAQLTAARALAIEKSTFAGVHVQLADAKEAGQLLRADLEHICFSAIILYSPRERHFNIYGQARRLPGSIALGKLTDDTISDDSYQADATDPEIFTTFSIVFSPTGSAVRSVNGRPVRFNANHPIFSDFTVDPNDILYTGSQRLWDFEDANNEAKNQYPITALTLFDMGDYLGADSKASYLNENGQFLPLNVYTGQLFARE